MAKFWVNDEGKLLTNDAGAPYLTDSCCCLNPVYCWKKWTAEYQINLETVCGIKGGTWTTPLVKAAQCNDNSRIAPDGNVGGVWRGYDAGVRYIWKLQAKYADNDKCAASCRYALSPSPPAPTGVPDCCILCSNTQALELPYHNYALANVKQTGWHIDDWEHYVSHVVSYWHGPIYNAVSNPFPAVMYEESIDKVTAELGPVRVTKNYLENYAKGLLDQPEGFAPATGAAYRAWSAARDQAHHGSYPYVTVTAPEYPEANGVYVHPYLQNYWVRTESVGNNGNLYWIGEDGALYGFYLSALGEEGEGYNVASFHIANAELVIGYSSYARIYEPGWTWNFGATQWGKLDITVANNLNGLYGSWHAIREARGGSCAKQDVHIASAGMGMTGATMHNSGSPLWYYRTYLTTDFPIATIDAENYSYAAWSANADRNATMTVSMACDLCYMYNYLYVTECRAICAEKGGTETCNWCTPTMVTTRIVTTDQPTVEVYQNVWQARTDSTCWMHSRYVANTNKTIMACYDPTLNGSVYKVIRLGLEHYPDWYTVNQCSNVLGPTAGVVPVPDMTDDGYYCVKCPNARTGCEWPYNYRAKPAHTLDTSYPGTWSAVAAIDHIDGGGTPGHCLCMASVMGSVDAIKAATEEYNQYVWNVPKANMFGFTGCPDWRFAVAAYTVKHHTSYCYWTSRHSDDTLTSHRLYFGSPSSTIEVAMVDDSRGDLTWNGNMSDVRSCQTGDPGIYEVYRGVSVGSHAYVITSVGACGFLIMQYPRFCCDNTDGLNIYTPITYDMAKGALSRTARAVLGGYDKCEWSALDAEDVISAAKGASVIYTHTEYYSRTALCSWYGVDLLGSKIKVMYSSNVLCSRLDSGVLVLTENVTLHGSDAIEFYIDELHRTEHDSKYQEEHESASRGDEGERERRYVWSSAYGSGSIVNDITDTTGSTIAVSRVYDAQAGTWKFVVPLVDDMAVGWISCNPTMQHMNVVASEFHETSYIKTDDDTWAKVYEYNNIYYRPINNHVPAVPETAKWTMIYGDGYDNGGLGCDVVLPYIGDDVTPSELPFWTKHVNGEDHAECIGSRSCTWSYYSRITDPTIPQYWEVRDFEVTSEYHAEATFSLIYKKEED